MTDKELIKQEIERRINTLKNGDANTEVMKRIEGVLIAYNSILQFIDSLPEEPKSQFPNYESIVDKVFGAGNLESFERSEAERLVLLAKEELLKDLEINKEPASEDLEIEIENYIKDSLAIKFPTTDKEQIEADIRYIARHFAEWGRNHFEDKSEMVSEDLEDAMELSISEEPILEFFATGQPTIGAYGKDSLRNQFEAGAEYQKEKDYKMYAHVPLKDIHDAWQKLKKNKPDIENYPSVCFQKGADWIENQMKESLQTEYEKGRFDMREEMMKDACDTKITTDGNSIFPIIKYQLPLTYDCKIGDKVKLIICKTEQQ